MKQLLFLSILFLLQGCLDSEQKAAENNSTQTLSQTAYIPFVETTGDTDTVMLYTTQGSVEKTKKIYEIVSTAESESLFSNFMVFGDYVYYDYLEAFLSDNMVRVKQIRTHITTNKTDIPRDVGTSNDSESRIKRVVVEDAFYIKKRFDNLDSYELEKYYKDGRSVHIAYPNNATSLFNTPMVKLRDKLYMMSSDGIVSLNTTDDTFSTLSLPEDLRVHTLISLDNTLYIFTTKFGEEGFQFWKYTQDGTTLVHTFSSKFSYGGFHTRINGSKLFFTSIERLSNAPLYCFDAQTQKITTISESSALRRARSFGTNVYYTSKSEDGKVVLWRSDGSILGTQKMLDAQGNSIRAKHLTVIEDKLFFSNITDAEGEELWVSDGENSQMLLDINKGSGSSFPRFMTKLNDGIVFQASPDGVNNHLYNYNKGLLEILK